MSRYTIYSKYFGSALGPTLMGPMSLPIHGILVVNPTTGNVETRS